MINEQPLVSVGIPTYNRPEGLRRTLECITKQTYKNLEIIVSDNCSPGGDTEAVVREFMVNDSRIQYFRQKENIGSFYNFQFVHEKAQGEYFAWAADDDDRTPEYLETCLQGFQKSEKLVLVNTFSELVDPQSEEVIKVDRGCTTIGMPAVYVTSDIYLPSLKNKQESEI
jgi:glycosyltransferase involved in cell wall biosynthesis